MTAINNDSALILGEPRSVPAGMVELQTRGDTVTMTLENLKSSDACRGIADEEFDRCLDSAANVTQKIVDLYRDRIADDEVGADGAARAITDAIASERFPNILLYGNVQAGKTVVMQLVTAMSLDNGFRLVIVLSPDSLSLLDQTATRFEDIDDPLSLVVRSSEPWREDSQMHRREMPRQGLIIVASKNTHNQKNLLEFLDEIRACDFPALVIDDEADQATPDSNVRRRARSNGGTVRASTINRRIIGNDHPDELGQSLMQKLPHSALLTVTATPQALLLQESSAAMRPDDVFVLEPGEGYVGGDHFFCDEALRQQGPLTFVDGDEVRKLTNARIRRIPPGLAASITTFVYSAAMLEIKEGHRPRKGHVFLCHSSYYKGHHDIVIRLVKGHIKRLLAYLRDGVADTLVEESIDAAKDVLGRRHEICPDLLERCNAWLVRQLPRRNILKVNSSGDRLKYRRGLNLLVGGNILGRGLTIHGLLTTYYLRSPQISQEDTMLQHARMFGYREQIRDYLNVFLTRNLAFRFAEIVKADRLLREHLARDGRSGHVPLRFVRGLRPTRPGVLDPRIMTVYSGGGSAAPMMPIHSASGTASARRTIDHLLECMCFHEDTDVVLDRGDEVVIPIDAMVDLISAIPVNEVEPSSWDPDAIKATLRMIAEEYGGTARVRIRRAANSREAVENGSGWLDGRERRRSVDSGVPVLHLHLVEGSRDQGWSGTRFWVPTVVFPTAMGHMMIAGE